MATIDPARFLHDLHDVRRIGTYKTGVHRPTYSPQDMDSRRWLMARMAEVGLAPTMDGIGNVLGRHPGRGPACARRQPYRSAELRRLAGRRAGRGRRAGPRPRRARGGRGGVRRRGGAFRGRLPRQPLLHRQAERRGDGPRPQPQRRLPAAGRPRRGRAGRVAAHDVRARTLPRLPRAAYRAGHHGWNRPAITRPLSPGSSPSGSSASPSRACRTTPAAPPWPSGGMPG